MTLGRRAISVQQSIVAGGARLPEVDAPDSFASEIVSSAAEFVALREEWDDLLDRSEATLFQSWEWLHSWWTHLGRGRLWLILLRRAGRLCGLAPLCISRYFGLRRLAFLGTGSSDYLQFLVAADMSDCGAARLLEAIAGGRREWDFCDLQQIPETSPLSRLSAPAGVEDTRFAQETCPYLPLPATWEEFSAGLGKKLRGNLGYYRRRLERDYKVEWITAGDGDIVKCMGAFFRLHQRRWNQRLLPGAFAGGAARRFHMLAADRLLERDWLRLHVLQLDDREEAALYCFRFRDRVYYYLGGFQPRLARYSPGTVLTGKAIAAAITEGATEFDFLRGDEPYKYAWGARDRRNWRWVWWQRRGIAALAPVLNRLERRVEARMKTLARSRRGPGRQAGTQPRESEASR